MKRKLPYFRMNLAPLWVSLFLLSFSLVAVSKHLPMEKWIRTDYNESAGTSFYLATAPLVTPGAPDNFITTWQIDADLTIIIPTRSGETYNYNIYWESITNSALNGTLTGQIGDATLTFPESGLYRIEINGTFPAIHFGSAASPDANDQKLITVEQWGNQVWQSMHEAFKGCVNLTSVSATDAPIFAQNCSLVEMFSHCSSFNSDLNHWDMSNVNNTESLFLQASSFNGRIDAWDVSNVTTMQQMFSNASAFNQQIGGWEVSNVVNMRRLFFRATNFNQDIGGWNVSSVENMNAMFEGASTFNQDIGGWNVSRVTSMEWMFQDAAMFNQDIGGWNVSSVVRMSNMFTRAHNFNQAIGEWDVSSVFDMSWMFAETEVFNQDLNDWDVGNVQNFQGMFRNAKAFNGDISDWIFPNARDMMWMFRGALKFNQDLSSWDVSLVEDMEGVFLEASSFNQNLGMWDVSSAIDMRNMLSNSGLSRENYDATLNGWASLGGLKNGNKLGAQGLLYCLGADARQTLIVDHGWEITGDTQDCLTMQLVIETEDGNTFTIRAAGSDSVQQVKQKIQDEAGFDPNKQQLFFNNSELEDGRTLSEYAIVNGSTLQLILKTNVTPSEDNILYVDSAVNINAPGYTGTGDSWANALPYLSDATKAALTNNDIKEIRVAAGTYYPTGEQNGTNRDSTFAILRGGLKVLGGFPNGGVGPRDIAANKTILSGNINVEASIEDNSYHVMVIAGIDAAADSIVVDGFTIQHGNANGGNPARRFFNGRHIRGEYAGGIYITFVENSLRTVIRNCVITENNADGRAGGLSTIASSICIEDCEVSKNFGSSGGGLNFSDAIGVETRVLRTRIIDNTAYTGAGGIFINQDYVICTDCVISGNRAPIGGGVYTLFSGSVKLINALISGNHATTSGGGLTSGFSAPIHLVNSTVSGNRADISGGGLDITNNGKATIHNSIVYGNNSGIAGAHYASRLELSHSLIQGGEENPALGVLDGTQNYALFINAPDPSLAPFTNGNYQLLPGSVVVDTGDNSYLPADVQEDLAGNQRVRASMGLNALVDLGAYEAAHRNVVSVGEMENIIVNYGTALTDVLSAVSGPLTTEVTLSDGSIVTLNIDNDTNNWVLSSPANSSYDGFIAGNYTFEVPIILPDGNDPEPLFNTNNLKAQLTITVDKDLPTLGVKWGTTAIDAGSGIDLTYGDESKIEITHTNTDLDAEASVAYTSGDAVLDLTDLSTVTAHSAGAGTVRVTLPETANFKETTFEFPVRVAQKELTITADAEQSKVYGETDPTLTYTASGLVLGDDGSVLTGSLGRASGENVGTYAINQGNLSAGANYEIVFVGEDFEITKAILTVTADADQSKVYGDTDPTLTYTLSGLVSGDDVSVVTGSLTRAPGENVGIYAINQGNLSAGANYEIVFVGEDFEITKAILNVTADADLNKVYGEADPTLTYNVTGLVSGDDDSVLTGSLERAPGENVGIYAINQGDLSAGLNYDIDFTGADFKISKANLTVTADADQSKVYGETDPTLTYKVTGLVSGDDVNVVTGSIERAPGENAGFYAMDRGNLSAGDNYTIVFQGADFEITKANLTVTADPNQSKVYGTTDPTLTYTVNGLVSGDDVSIVTGSLERVPGENAGFYAMDRGNLSAGANYEIVFVGEDFEITKAILQVTADADQSKVYGDTDPTLTYTVSGLVSGDNLSVMTGSLGRAPGENTGDYTINQGDLSGGINYEIDFTSADFVITKAILTVTADADQSKVYGDTDPTLTYTVSGLVSGDNLSVMTGSLGRAPGENVGIYAINQGNLSAGDNYDVVYVGTDFEITKAILTVTARPNQRKIYGAADPTLTYMVTGLASGDDVSVLTGLLARAPGENVGIYPINQGDLSVSGNYEINFIGADFEITKASLTVTADSDQSKVYGETDPTLTYKVSGLVLGDDVSVLTGSLERIPGENVGNYAINQGNLNAGNNYSIAFNSADFEITKENLTVTADPNQGKVYGTTDPSLTYKVSGFVSGDDLSIFTGSLKRASGENVGTYAINLGSLSAGDNYKIAFISGDFEITKAILTVTADPDQSKVYGETDPTLTYTLTGLAPIDNSSVITGALARMPGENVGTYVINQGTLRTSDNYTIDFVYSEFVILPANITGITFENGSFVYDGTEKTIQITGNLPTGATVSYANNSRTNAGTQTATATLTGSNYHPLVLTADLSITPGNRSITFPPIADKTYGDSPFATGATVSNGEQIIYSSSNLDVATVSNQGIITITGAGDVSITATVAENSNYSNTPVVSRSFTVEKAVQTISHNIPAEVNRNSGTITLETNTTSGLPITLSLDDEQVATLNGNALNVLRIGTVKITLSQAGNANYKAAEPITVTIRVVDPSADFEVIVHPVVSPNGDGINDFLMIEGIRDYPDNKITIFNQRGTIVYDVKNYNNGTIAFRGLNKNGAKLPTGTYFYIVELRKDGTWVHKKGYFVLRQ